MHLLCESAPIHKVINLKNEYYFQTVRIEFKNCWIFFKRVLFQLNSLIPYFNWVSRLILLRKFLNYLQFSIVFFLQLIQEPDQQNVHLLNLYSKSLLSFLPGLCLKHSDHFIKCPVGPVLRLQKRHRWALARYSSTELLFSRIFNQSR